MILYTLMPYELVFPYENNEFPKQLTIMYNSIPLLVEQSDPQTLSVLRVLSSDPQHFLDDRVFPGTKISLLNLNGLSAT